MSQPGVVLFQKADAFRRAGHIKDAIQNYQKAIYYNKILNTSSEDVQLGIARIRGFVSSRIPEEILEVVWLRLMVIVFFRAPKLLISLRTCLRAEAYINPGAVIHRTCTRDYSITASEARRRKHRRYRMVLQDCRGNLSTFKDVKELLSVMHDALITHEDAYTKAKVLYRSISVGNILISEDGKGLLVDWELSKSNSELGNARQSAPWDTGTWQFISAALLSNPDAHATRADCLESYFHVLSWIALQYTNHSTSPSRVAKHLTLVYDDYDEEEDQILGGSMKRDKMLSASLTRIKFALGPLADLIEDLEETCASRYATDPDPKRLDIVLKVLAKEDISEEERDSIYLDNIHYQKYERRQRLTSAKWFIDRFEEAVVSDNWSERSLERREIRFPMKKYWS